MSNLQKISHLDPESILDLGAWIGEWAKEAHQIWPRATILSIEGNPACESHLAATGLPYRIAMLGGKLASRPYFKQNGTDLGTGNSLFKEDTEFFSEDSYEMVTVYPLMKIIENEKFDLIKADLQGAELEVLLSAIPILNSAKYLLIEFPISHYNIGAPTGSEVTKFLSENGFNEYEVLEEIVHPIDRYIVQQDRIYIR